MPGGAQRYLRVLAAESAGGNPKNVEDAHLCLLDDRGGQLIEAQTARVARESSDYRVQMFSVKWPAA